MKTRVFQFDRHGDFNELTLRSQELPEPGPGQALVRMRAVGLNNSEARYVGGRYAPPPFFPTSLGMEGVGEIVALGPIDPEKRAPTQTPLRVGARVALIPGRVDAAGMGSYREHGLYPHSALAPVPEGFTDVEGAALWMGLLTAAGALHAAGLTRDNAEGKRVLITAATSGVGIIALKLLRAWGATTIATTRSAAKARALEPCADRVLVCAEPAALAALVKGATDGKGFDVALDPVGAEYLGPMIEAAAPGAQIAFYEMISGREAPISIPMLMIKDLGVHGFTLFRLLRNPALLESIVAEGVRLGEALRPVIAQTFAFEEAPKALATLVKSEHVGKLVLTLP